MAKMVKPGTYIKYGKMLNPRSDVDADDKAYTEDDVRAIFNDIVWTAVGRDVSMKLSDLLWPDVFQDVKECSGFPKNLNYDDVRLAFGRVLCKRLGVENE